MLSFCNANFRDVQSSLGGYQEKIDEYRQRTEDARSEVAADAELDLLQRKLEEELEKEYLLGEELRAIGNDYGVLEQHRISVQEQKKSSQKLEQDELRIEMLLSMCASVTNVIPALDDQLKISGYFLEKDKYTVKKFEFDLSKMTALDICDDIWKMTSP